MFCKKCGAPLKDDAIKCALCGQPAPDYEGAMPDCNQETTKSGDKVQQADDTQYNQSANAEVYTINQSSSIKSHLFASVFVTLLCCQITGVIALYHSGKVAVLASMGDMETAALHSKKAITWIIVSLIAWFIMICFVLTFFALVFAA